MKKLLYFAYGSNLLTRRLEARIGHTDFIRTYRLQDYNLVFNCGGFANIEPSEGSYVDGALYTMTSDQMSELNRFEGFYNAEFFDYDKDTLVVVYVGREDIVNRSTRILPEREYLDIIMLGAAEKRLGLLYTKVDDIRRRLPIRPIKSNKTPKKKLRRK